MMNINNKKTLSSIKIPKLIQIVVKIMSLFSTKLTLKFATFLFVSPVKFKVPKRELQMLETSKVSFDELKQINKKIRVLVYGYSDKKVLLVHGWSGRATQLFMTANKLLENGYMVIAFDGPAHGQSKGKTTNLLEFINTIEYVVSKYGPFEAAIGHSFGSIAILNTQAKHHFFKSIVTIGSGDYFSDISKNFVQNLGLSPKFGKKVEYYFKKKWNVNPNDFASSIAAKSIKAPCLVVHDSTDGDVDVSCSVAIRQSLKNGQLYITQNLGHTKILREPFVSNKIVEFIKSNT